MGARSAWTPTTLQRLFGGLATCGASDCVRLARVWGCVVGRGPAVFVLARIGRPGPVLLLPVGFVQRILDVA
jgi:hypothetical protein